MIEDVNPFLVNLLGFSKEDFLEKYIWEIGALKNIAASKDRFEKLQKEKYVRYEDLPLETKDGENIHVEFVSNEYSVEEDKIIQCNIRDITERVKTAKLLHEVAERHSAILKAIPDIVMEVDTEKRYVWANEAGYEFFGKDVIGKRADYYFEGKQDTYKKIRPVFEGSEEVVYVESWQKRKDGEHRLLAWWSKTLKNENGEVTGALSTARDITKERLIQQEIEENEKRYRITIQKAGQLIYEYSIDTGKITWNGAIKKITGYTKEEFSKVDIKKWTEMIHLEDREKATALLDKALKGTGDYETEYRFKTKGGDYINILDRGASVKNEEGVFVKMYGAMSNITERVESKKRVEEENATNNAILSSIGDAVVAFDGEGKIILCNKMAQELTEFTSNEMLGKHYQAVLNFVKESDPKIEADFIEKTISTNKMTEKTMTNHTLLITKSGKKIPTASSAAPVIDKDNNTIGYVIAFMDMSKAREIDRVKTEFVSMASHELKTPLSTINWYTEILQTRDNENFNETQKEYINQVHKSSKDMVKLVNALLNVSRLELGTFTIIPEKIDMTRVMDACIKEVEFQLQEKEITLKKNYAKNLPEINADPNLLKTVFRNVLSNSVKYTQPKGSIDVEINKTDGSFKIQVSDTGVGIPKKQQSGVFTKMFRADNAKQMESSGTGLGLYTVKQIVEHSNGNVWFESEENKGTKFYITFPEAGMVEKKGTKKLV